VSATVLTARGVDHVALTVSDLEVSQSFYHRVLGLTPVFDFGTTRILMDRRTGFTLALLHHEEQQPGGFTHARVGLDHVGFAVPTREELEVWQDRLHELGVTYTPIRDMEFGHHLNFRDPDGIALELNAPNDLYRQAMAMLAAHEFTEDELRAAAAQLSGMPDAIVDVTTESPAP
jgi:catechol 2,3-dioxygenase-like lactoylglutathione lyase family enzyme